MVCLTQPQRRTMLLALLPLATSALHLRASDVDRRALLRTVGGTVGGTVVGASVGASVGSTVGE